MGESFELRARENMLLPNGKKCIDCQWFKSHCQWLLSRQGDEKVCDWSPSRFIQVTYEANGLPKES